ncbi:MAG: hypothetical protein DID90_2727554901 [Candidatus Nitrotoga sp. LAW]|nr:MAG: hypothetical protein DID90_2727554901 [Candidatus Nitrotoga sp. LAW]
MENSGPKSTEKGFFYSVNLELRGCRAFRQESSPNKIDT